MRFRRLEIDGLHRMVLVVCNPAVLGRHHAGANFVTTSVCSPRVVNTMTTPRHISAEFDSHLPSGLEVAVTYEYRDADAVTGAKESILLLAVEPYTHDEEGSLCVNECMMVESDLSESALGHLRTEARTDGRIRLGLDV